MGAIHSIAHECSSPAAVLDPNNMDSTKAMQHVMFFLPAEILEEILAKLPANSLGRFRCVSQGWNMLIKSPGFLNKYHGQSEYRIMISGSTSDDIEFHFCIRSPLEVQICNLHLLGACNGVLCVSDNAFIPSEIWLWNPATGSSKALPNINRRCYGQRTYGFGYDANCDDYIVLVICMGGTEIDHSSVEVYSLRNNSWRSSEKIPYTVIVSSKAGILASGAIHWLGTTSTEKGYFVVAFSLQDRKFRKVCLPDYGDDSMLGNIVLDSLDGYLCTLHRCNSGVDVWTMMEYGVPKSWMKLFTLTIEGALIYSKLVCFTKEDGDLLFKDRRNILLYNTRSKGVKKLLTTGATSGAVTYMESHVPLGTDNEALVPRVLSHKLGVKKFEIDFPSSGESSH